MSTLPPSVPARRLTQGVAPELSARCSGCAAALAPDQLFCLSCGTRRRDARIAFRDVLASEAMPVVAAGQGGGPTPPVVAAGGGAIAGGPPVGSYTPFIAILALLLLALGLGFWMGRGQQAPVAAAAPITVPVAATTPAAPVETTPADDAADDTAKDDAKDDAAAADDAPVAGGSAALKKLEQLSPEEYQKQSQKLPKEVGTGGKAPAKDNKTGGGGTEFESFE